MFYCPGK
ncbi:hypothetical protein AYI69_g8670, partial [Smittium culicis]